MENQCRDNTDASSIKPVSSLLSHFEQLNKPASEERTRQSRSQSPNPRFNHSCLNSPAPSPRIDVRHSPHKNSQDDRGGLSTAATDGVRQRLGIGLNPAAQESPSVTIEPPQSPPKPLNLNLTMSSPSDFLSAEGPKIFSSPGISSPRHFRIPSRPHTPLVDQRKSPLLPPSASSKPPEPPPPRRSAELRRDPPAKALPRLPPPVNRAEKPKIPAKHNTGLEYINDKQVVPQDPARLKVSGHSPYSLSTSRGVSPERDSMLLPPAMPSRPTTQEIKPLARSNTTVFNPPPLYHTLIRRRENEFNSSDINVERGLVDNLDEQRPALPARPSFPLPSRMSMDLSRWSKAPSIPLDGPHVLKSGVQVQRPTEDSNLVTSNPKRNVSTPISSNAPTPPKSHGRSMTVDQLNIQAPENYRASSRIGPGVLETPITRSSYAASQITAGNASVSLEYPDPSRSNRRFPWLSHSAGEIPIKYDARLFDVVGEYACTSGTFTRVWSLVTGEQIMGLAHGETIKILSVSFKASPTPDDEGHRLWLGNNVGDLFEVDIDSQSIVATKSAAHSRHEVIKIYRRTNAMWTLDDVGTLHVWAPDKTGSLSFSVLPQTFRLPKGHTFSLVVGNELWYATGKDVRIFHPTVDGRAQFQLLQRPLCQPGAGDIVSGATINSQPDRVYFGHTDGKITIYACDTYACLGIVNVSVYKVSSLAGVGQYLWAGFSTGIIYVYDTSKTPWTVKKDWRAHANPVIGVLVDRSHVWKQDHLQVVSLGADNILKTWDGLLEEDWLENDIQARDADFCTFENIKTLVMTWNAGASTPHSLRYSEQDSNFVRDLLMSSGSPDILVFGFQELVDLEDKKATAISFFKSKKKDSSEQERMSHQYRDWRDYLIRCLDDYMPKTELYHLLQSSTLVGLFTCIFVKSHLRDRITSLSVTEIKRGMGGLHGNKGALIVRFILDSTSMCFVNCHLAAGQTQTKVRNYDISAILEGENILPVERDPTARLDSFIGGGDGSMILDHEICIVNGDLNYRIDTMGRDSVVNTVKAGNLEKLLERDQLLVSKRKNPGFRLRYFQEMPITFNPTYKYDVGTDTYDTSEKKRAPAWCDRILYRDGHNAKRIRQFDYRRHEVRVSDHRPVSALFEMTIKSIVPEKRAAAWDKSVKRFEGVKQELLRPNSY